MRRLAVGATSLGMMLGVPAAVAADTPSAKALFETNCSACHTLALPRSQHLNRANWEWVMEDMTTKFGCNWLTEEQQQQIIDYLVEHHGPDSG